MAKDEYVQQVLDVQGLEIKVKSKDYENDFFSLTDIARYKNIDEPNVVVANWLRLRNTIEYLGIWEQIYNPNFKPLEFEGFKKESGSNSFTLSPKKWIESTSAIGLISKAGRYNSGTFAHKDIALEFASWISPEFKLYIIKEFQRLKQDENVQQKLEWNLKRTLSKVNYKIQTDAIQNYLITEELSKKEKGYTFASEADVLNIAMFNMTAKEWRETTGIKNGNIRDYANINQLIVLSNLESINAEYIADGLPKEERIEKLNKIAVRQMNSLINNKSLNKLIEK